jgi:hypothetical protein
MNLQNTINYLQCFQVAVGAFKDSVPVDAAVHCFLGEQLREVRFQLINFTLSQIGKVRAKTSKVHGTFSVKNSTSEHHHSSKVPPSTKIRQMNAMSIVGVYYESTLPLLGKSCCDVSKQKTSWPTLAHQQPGKLEVNSGFFPAVQN